MDIFIIDISYVACDICNISFMMIYSKFLHTFVLLYILFFNAELIYGLKYYCFRIGQEDNNKSRLLKIIRTVM